MFAVLFLLAVALMSCGRRHHVKKGAGLLVGESEDDIRDNVLNYNEQGGGEEDEVRPTCSDRLSLLPAFYPSHRFSRPTSQNAFNIDLLWNPHDAPPNPWAFYPGSGVPRGKQPLRKDAPQNLPSPTYPRRRPADPSDIEDYINDVSGSFHVL